MFLLSSFAHIQSLSHPSITGIILSELCYESRLLRVDVRCLQVWSAGTVSKHLASHVAKGRSAAITIVQHATGVVAARWNISVGIILLH
jgi:hypothetical protein